MCFAQCSGCLAPSAGPCQDLFTGVCFPRVNYTLPDGVSFEFRCRYDLKDCGGDNYGTLAVSQAVDALVRVVNFENTKKLREQNDIKSVDAALLEVYSKSPNKEKSEESRGKGKGKKSLVRAKKTQKTQQTILSADDIEAKIQEAVNRRVKEEVDKQVEAKVQAALEDKKQPVTAPKVHARSHKLEDAITHTAKTKAEKEAAAKMEAEEKEMMEKAAAEKAAAEEAEKKAEAEAEAERIAEVKKAAAEKAAAAEKEAAEKAKIIAENPPAVAAVLVPSPQPLVDAALPSAHPMTAEARQKLAEENTKLLKLQKDMKENQEAEKAVLEQQEENRLKQQEAERIGKDTEDETVTHWIDAQKGPKTPAEVIANQQQLLSQQQTQQQTHEQITPWSPYDEARRLAEKQDQYDKEHPGSVTLRAAQQHMTSIGGGDYAAKYFSAAHPWTPEIQKLLDQGLPIPDSYKQA
jgi:hypothetical protein